MYVYLWKKTYLKNSDIGNWYDKVYSVKRVLATRSITYIVEDDKEKQYEESFYEQDLQKVGTDVYGVRKISKYKTEKGIEYAFVY